MRIIDTLCVLAACLALGSAATRLDTMGEWTMHIYGSPKKEFEGLNLTTSMPTSLHLDLLRHNKISDPFIGATWESEKWISECNITYAKKLNLTGDLLIHDNIELVLEGIDTYATVFFNGQELLKTENAFVEYRAHVPKDIIIQGEN